MKYPPNRKEFHDKTQFVREFADLIDNRTSNKRSSQIAKIKVYPSNLKKLRTHTTQINIYHHMTQEIKNFFFPRNIPST